VTTIDGQAKAKATMIHLGVHPRGKMVRMFYGPMLSLDSQFHLGT